MEIYGRALATQGFESPRLQTSPCRLKLQEATSGRPNFAALLIIKLQIGAKSARRSPLEFQTTGRSLAFVSIH
jgi:hypothetical protein